MLKEAVQYENFNGVNVTETLYFNITKAELMDNLHLRDDLQEMEDSLSGPERELSMLEVRKILDLVKTFMRLSYGALSEDGKFFRKSDEIWADFQATAAYDAYLTSLFEEPEKAINFLLSVLPKDLRAAAEKEVQGQAATVTQLPTAPPVLVGEPATPEEVSAGTDSSTSIEPASAGEGIAEKKFKDYTKEELLSMPQEQFQALVPKSPKNMSQEQLLIAFERKNKGD